MKSWDRRGWWKSADISQMLLVLDRVKTEDEAKAVPLPKALDEKTWQWPDGLTPPMQNVRKRRFRKRVSHRTIEKAEEEVERLIALDESFKAQGGRIESTIIDLNRDYDSGDEYGYNREDGGEDYPTFDVADGDAEGDEDEEDAEAMATRMAMELGADMENDGDMFGSDPAQASIEAGTPFVDTNAPSPAVEPVSTDADDAVAEESDGSGDEDASLNGDDEEEEDEDEREQAQYLVQQREEIEHLEHEVQVAREQLNKTTNPFLKQKVMNKIRSLEGDLEVKKRGLGVDEDA